MKKKSHLPDKFIKEIEAQLLVEEKRLEEKLKKLSEYDPFLVPDRDVGNAEEMDEAEEGLGHERVETERISLKNLLAETKEALARIRKGTYGFCDNCGEPIDQARLEIYPQAHYCMECEKTVGREE